MRPGRKLQVGDQAVCAIHIAADSLQELCLSFKFDGNLASEDRVHHVSGTDILVSRVPILVVVFVFVAMSVLFPVFLGGVPLSSPLCVDAFEDMAFFHHVIGFGMELAWPFQRLVVVFLVVSSPIWALDCIHLVIVITGSLTPEIVAIVTSRVPSFSVVAVATEVPVVEASTTVVSSWKLVGASRIFSNELFYVIDISIIFGRGEELGNRGRPFTQ